MKKFTKITFIVAAVLLGVGLIFCGVSTAMGASVWRMAKNGELRYGNWHIGPDGLYYSGSDYDDDDDYDDNDDYDDDDDDDDYDDDDDLDADDKDIVDLVSDIGDADFSTEVPSGEADQSYDASSIQNINMDIDAAEITVRESDDSAKLRVVLKRGKEKYYSCKTDGNTLKIKYDAKKHYYKKSPQIILYLPKGSSFDELNFDIGAADMNWKDFDGSCNDLTLKVGAGNFEAKRFQVNGKMDVSVGVGNVEIEDGVVNGDASIDCGVGNFSMDGSVEGNLKADCGMGNMTLDLNSEEKEYNYKLSCGLGSIEVDGETYTNISGDKEVQNEGAKKNMELDCGMGSIEVDFE